MRRASLLACFLGACSVAGCAKKADEKKPTPQVKAEAEAMNADDLREMALAYKEAILAKRKDVERMAEKIKEIPITEILSEEGKRLKAEVDTLLRSVAALTERFEIYYDRLRETNVDLSEVSLPGSS